MKCCKDQVVYVHLTSLVWSSIAIPMVDTKWSILGQNPSVGQGDHLLHLHGRHSTERGDLVYG